MGSDRLEELFPGLRTSRYVITSEPADAPNCIGWALGSELYFDPKLGGFIGGYYWPDGVLKDDTTAAWIQLFELHGYQQCNTGALEPRTEKIAIYVDEGGEAQHVAKQLPSGAWSSKLGKLEDIEHDTLAAIVSYDYGSLFKFMKRPLA
jgi:hypothetical protein